MPATIISTNLVTIPIIQIIDATLTFPTTLITQPLLTVIKQVETILATVTASTDVVSTSTGFPDPLPKRGIYRKPSKPKNVQRYSDNAITQACLYVLYGSNHLAPTTTTKTVMATSTSIALQDILSTSLVTSLATDYATEVVTKVLTQTDIPLPVTVTTTSVVTNPVTTIVPPTVDVGIGGSYTLAGRTFTCTWLPSNGNGLKSSFIAPCKGTMSVQLKGAGGGDSNANGGAAPGHAVQSQILLGGSTTIPALTAYDIYVGGFGAYGGAGGAGGFNGGGRSGPGGAGGGGSIDIRYQGHRLAIAAGGGGNGNARSSTPGNPGYGDADPQKTYTTTGNGADGTLSGTGGGGGLLGGTAGRQIGYGGISGSDKGTVIDFLTIGFMPKAVVTYTCTA